MIHRMNVQLPHLVEGRTEAKQTNPFLLFMATLVAATAVPEILLRQLGL